MMFHNHFYKNHNKEINKFAKVLKLTNVDYIYTHEATVLRYRYKSDISTIFTAKHQQGHLPSVQPKYFWNSSLNYDPYYR